MGLLSIEGVTHWSIPVNDLDESEKFYGDLLGLTHRGRLGGALISCFAVGENNILLCQQPQPLEKSAVGVHHSFTVAPETLDRACKVLRDEKVNVDVLIYRGQGFFTGRELYFYDPSGNRLELRDPTWVKGMPEPTMDEIIAASEAAVAPTT
jgi:extradiol dioxygenase family protein